MSTAWRIHVARTQKPLALQARWARSLSARMIGLLNRRHLPPGEGLILTPCQAIHMCFMRFPIDAVFVNRRWQVVRLLPNLRPWRWSPWVWAAWGVIELPAGSIQRAGVTVGDHLLAQAGGGEHA